MVKVVASCHQRGVPQGGPQTDPPPSCMCVHSGVIWVGTAWQGAEGGVRYARWGAYSGVLSAAVRGQLQTNGAVQQCTHF